MLPVVQSERAYRGVVSAGMRCYAAGGSKERVLSRNGWAQKYLQVPRTPADPCAPLGSGVARLSPGPQVVGTIRINSAGTTAYVLYLGTCDYS